MTNRQAHILALAAALDAVDIERAHDDVRQRLAVNTALDTTPCTYEATHAELVAASRHEAAHAIFSYSTGDTVLTVSLRADATGCCRVETRVGDRQALQDRVTMLLCGVAANLRHDPAFIVRPSSDLIEARIKLVLCQKSISV
jgi:hypothetical protein